MQSDQHLVHPKYRPDIDGLRAIAVLAVVGFHFFPTVLTGGFVGVDIFFVISGYLISSIILSSIDKGQFSLLEFYVRRTKRIFPALAVVMFLSLVCGWWMLFPSEYALLGKQISAGAAFVSNILFWRESGYFDTSSELKPMLHLWSLGIEEQFYIFWPLLLLLISKFARRSLSIIIPLVLLVSFLLNVTFVAAKPTGVFFLPVTRFWELLTGAFLAHITLSKGGVATALSQYWKKGAHPIFDAKCNEVMSWLGGGLLVLALVRVDSRTIFPGWWALLPTLGTFFVIAGGGATWFNRNILGLKVFVSIGLISYPLYLWHWPLLVFLRTEFGEIHLAGRLMLLLLGFFLAWGTYKWIEKPLRSSKRTFVSWLLVVVVAFQGGLGFIIYQGVVTNDKNDARSNFVRHFENVAPQFQYFKNQHVAIDYRFDCDFLDVFTKQVRREIAKDCYTPISDVSVFVWGDSHAQQLNRGLIRSLPKSISVLQVATSGCNPSFSDVARDTFGACNKSNRFAIEIIARTRPDLVLLAQRDGHEKVDWDAVSFRLKQLGVKEVLLVGPVPHWQPDLYKLIARKLPNVSNRFAEGFDAQVSSVDKQLKVKYGNGSHHIKYVSLVDTLCDQGGCLAYIGQDALAGITSFDYGHLTGVASEFVGQSLSEVVVKSTRGTRN